MTTSSAPTAVNPLAKTKYIFSFGDSYTETGFVLAGPQPSPNPNNNPLGNPPFPGQTTCAGVNWIGHLVTTFTKTPICAYNFAFSGGVVDREIVVPYMKEVQTLVDQVGSCGEVLKRWEREGTGKGDGAGEALFAVWFGINDIGTSWGRDCDEIWVEKVLKSYFEQIQILYEAGGRKFVFLTVPPINKTPVMLEQILAVQELEASAVAVYNSQLAERAARFKEANVESEVWVFDTQVPFNLAIKDPIKYGAKDATGWNNDGTSCLWWNDYHPGQALQRLVAEGVTGLVGEAFF